MASQENQEEIGLVIRSFCEIKIMFDIKMQFLKQLETLTTNEIKMLEQNHQLETAMLRLQNSKNGTQNKKRRNVY